MAKSASNGKSGIAIFAVSSIFKFLFAASFLMMPFASNISLNEEKNGFLYFVGALFWATLILSVVTSILLTKKQKAYFLGKENTNLPKRPAIITFFSSKEAKIADILMIVFIVAFILCTILTDSYLIYVFLFLSVLFVELHCLFNGKNYLYIKELKSGGKA